MGRPPAAPAPDRGDREGLVVIRLPLVDRLKFFVERQFVKGAGFQLLIVAALIGAISVLGGAAMLLGGGEGSLPDAIWWAFLRLTDPGYLGDDVGGWRRFVSTLLTISGYVVFLGALVAILTQWLIGRMREFERGLTPVALTNHVVIIGWTNRTLPLLRELVGTQRAERRFLRSFGLRRVTPVVLSEDVSAVQAQELRGDPVLSHSANRIILRYGSALEEEAIQRAACLNAAVVLLPSDFGFRGQDVGQGLDPDVETIRVLLSMDARAADAGSTPPRVVAEVQDERRLAVVQRAYRGPLEAVASDRTISRMLLQTLLHPGLAAFLRETLTSLDGNEFHLRPAGRLAGAPLKEIAARVPRARVLGLVRDRAGDRTALLGPPSDTVVEADDRVILLARESADVEFERSGSARVGTVHRPSRPAPSRRGRPSHRVLLLGWNARVPVLLQTLAARDDRHWDVDLLSFVPLEERRAALEGRDTGDALTLTQYEDDYLLEGVLEKLPLADYRSIVLLTSDRLGSSEEADARAIVGHRMLEALLEGQDRQPHRIIELADAANEGLVRGARAETLIPPLLMSHVLAQLALRPELGVVFNALFAPDGPELEFHPCAHYRVRGSTTFAEFDASVAEAGDLLVGVRLRRAGDVPHELVLNPPRDTSFEANDDLEALVLTRGT